MLWLGCLWLPQRRCAAQSLVPTVNEAPREVPSCSHAQRLRDRHFGETVGGGTLDRLHDQFRRASYPRPTRSAQHDHRDAECNGIRVKGSVPFDSLDAIVGKLVRSR